MLTPDNYDSLAVQSGGRLESWMTNPPKPAMWHFTPDQRDAFARAIEADVRKDDEALIRQLRDALEMCSGVPHWPSLQPTIAAANARLLDSDLSTLTERGAKAWAGVDPQKLREGGAL